MTLTGEPAANTGFVGKIKLKKHLKAYFDKCMLASKIAYNWARSQNLAEYPAYLEAKETYLNSIKELSDEAFLRELRVWKEANKKEYKEVISEKGEPTLEVALAKKDELIKAMGDLWSKQNKKDYITSPMELRKKLRILKDEFPDQWTCFSGVDCGTYTGAIYLDYANAIKRFGKDFSKNKARIDNLKKRSKRRFEYPRDYGFPQWKKKGTSFHMMEVLIKNIDYENNRVKLPKVGWVQIWKNQKIPKFVYPSKNVANPIIVTDGIDYYFSFSYYKAPEPFYTEDSDVIGIDLGVKELAVCSDGTRIENMFFDKKFQRLLKKKDRLNKAISRLLNGASHVYREIEESIKSLDNERRAYSRSIKDKTSEEYLKKIEEFETKRNELVRKKYFTETKQIRRYRERILKAEIDLNNYKKYKRHEIAYNIVAKNPKGIVFEDLDGVEMMQKKDLAPILQQTGWGVLKETVVQHAKKHNIVCKEVDRYFASSQICSACGHRDSSMKDLSKRTFVCEKCGAIIDRDLNAALNLKKQWNEDIKVIS